MKSELEIQEMVKLYVTNFFAIVFSLGLAIPWATIRVAKYKSTRMKLLETTGALEAIEKDSQSAQGAIADAAGDFLDIDLGF